jgi:hypothetical protein
MSQLITDGLTAADEKQLTEILKKWKGGALSDSLFTSLAQMLPMPCVESIVFRKVKGRTECLLTPRPENDPIWPGFIHSPGSVLRAIDFRRPDGVAVNGPFERVQKNEIMNKFEYPPIFVDIHTHLGARGPEVLLIHFTSISKHAVLPAGCLWADVGSLLERPNFIKHQQPAILMAAKKFNEEIS